MKLVIYGAETERGELQQLLTQLPACGYRDVRVEGYGEYDRFIAGLRESPPDCIVVTMNGAGGMEGVIAACRLCGAVPVVRFPAAAASLSSPIGWAALIFTKSLWQRSAYRQRSHNVCKGE